MYKITNEWKSNKVFFVQHKEMKTARTMVGMLLNKLVNN